MKNYCYYLRDSILDNIPAPAILITSTGRIRMMNEAAQRMFAQGLTNIVVLQARQLFVECSLEDDGAFLETLKQGPFPKTFELTGRRHVGPNFPCELTVARVENRGRDFYMAIVHDLTKRREVERLRRELTAMVSHDLGAPLSSVLGSLALLSVGALGELPLEARSVVTVAQNEVERLKNLVKDLLDVSRIEAGRLPLRLDDCSLKTIVERSVNSMAALAENKGISICVASTDFELYADENRLAQVIINLISNAIKASAQGRSIHIYAKRADGSVSIFVRDFGAGIAQEDLSGIFAPYVRLHEGDTDQTPGTGLGLAICKAIVEQHGGTLGVTSQLGQGSTFWFKLPVVPSVNFDAPAWTRGQPCGDTRPKCYGVDYKYHQS